jgi:hypothetical protein
MVPGPISQGQRDAVALITLDRARIDDPLLSLGIALEQAGDYPAAMDVLVARWLLLPTDPSGPWNCVAAARHADTDLFVPLLQVLTAWALIESGTASGQDDEWFGNALAFAIDGFLDRGAVVCAAVAARSVTDAGERQDAQERIRGLLAR